jgi:hypothetical protein
MIAEHAVGGGHIALGQRRANTGGGYRLGAFGQQVQDIDRESVDLSGGAEEVGGATPVVPEVEVAANRDARDAQGLDQEARHEILCLEHRQVAAERHQHDAVEPQGGAQSSLVVGRGQAEHERGRCKHVARMRLERQHHGGHTARPRVFLEPRQDRLVPAVHAIERADGDHGTLERLGNYLEPVEAVEAGHASIRRGGSPLYDAGRPTTQGAA